MTIDAEALVGLADLNPNSEEAEAFMTAYDEEDSAAIQRTGKKLVDLLLSLGDIDGDEATAILNPRSGPLLNHSNDQEA